VQHLSHLFAYFVAFFLSAVMVMVVFSLLVLPIKPELHWTERARKLSPARSAFLVMLSAMPLSMSVPFVLREERLVAVAVFCLAMLGLSLGSSLFSKHLQDSDFPREPFVTSMFAWFLNLGASWGVVLLVRLFLPKEATWEVLLGLLLVILALSGHLGFWLSRLLGLMTRFAQEEKGPPIYEWKISTANAFAFPLSGHIVVTSPTTKLLRPEELSAIMSHEKGHLLETRWISWARLGVLLSLAVPVVIQNPLQYRLGLELPGFLLVVSLLFFVVTQLFRRVAHQEEQRADKEAEHDSNPGVYAKALEKIYRANLLPAVNAVKSTHPDLYDRMVAAGVTPDYPRPQKPKRLVGFLLGIAVSAMSIALGVWLWR
jgi:Zn-dependent protease with chaperone function